MRKSLYIAIFLILYGILNSVAQVRIEVFTDTLLFPNKPIFLASSLNNWHPSDPAWKLRKVGQNHYQIDIPDEIEEFEYKFTQGNWNCVEAGKNDQLLPNRYYSKAQIQDKTVRLKIEGWESRPEFEIHITKVPKNTPKDASIYISGNFNSWEEGDEFFKLEKQFDGTYKIKIFSKYDELEYKFNRGDWNSAESWKNGKARPNRLTHKNSLVDNEDIEIEIENWEDLTATFNFFSIVDLLMLFAAFQGILLMIAIPSIQDFNRDANRLLVILLGISSVFLFFRVIGYYRDVANAFPKLILFPTFVLFVYAPLFFLYLQKLLFKKVFSVSQTVPHFILFFVQLMVFVPYILMEGKRFQHKIVNNESDLKWVFAVGFAIAIFSNLYYYFLSKTALKRYSERYINETAYLQNLNYLNTVLIIHMACIALGVFTAAVFIINEFVFPTGNLLDSSISIIWLTFSLIGYILGYYAIHQPEIFKINSEEHHETHFEEEPKQETNKTKNLFGADEIAAYKDQIEELIQNRKPHLNPNLTLNDLANMLGMPSHTLSKVIKEVYNKNFFDFINTCRIEEFKDNINNPKYHNYTLLGIAFEVGFNSKTAFNRAFKKMTNQTPSEFYQSRK